jgi:murein DD-endopeptidase MepM/ murein hydrolase activator NlpD
MKAWAAEQGQVVEESPLRFASSPRLELPGFMFGWPLEGSVLSGFGMRDGRMHQGIDIDAAAGAPVGASAPGTVITAGYNAGGYGNVVVIDHGDGFSSLYAHLSEIDVAVGDEVDPGQLVGAVGCTGTCSGDHLHFEIRINGEAVDPLDYLPAGPLFLPASTSRQYE